MGEHLAPETVWLTIWKWTLILGLGSFFLLALVIIPLGAFDIRKFFQRLNSTQFRSENDCNDKAS